jgi:hypothetical protein
MKMMLNLVIRALKTEKIRSVKHSTPGTINAPGRPPKGQAINP